MRVGSPSCVILIPFFNRLKFSVTRPNISEEDEAVLVAELIEEIVKDGTNSRRLSQLM